MYKAFSVLSNEGFQGQYILICGLNRADYLVIPYMRKMY